MTDLCPGAVYLGGNRCRFRVWAPFREKVEVRIVSPKERTLALASAGNGWHEAVLEKIPPGSLYLYRLDGKIDRPDPASRFQPRGVHQPSAVLDTSFKWEDSLWKGFPLEKYIFYEIHAGTFTPEGTFEAVIPGLKSLKELGITAIELMPVCQFPGKRNWGYDGVHPYSVQNSYGGPRGLKRLVQSCHKLGLAVVLDVVYNHLGPEGNYLADFGPYFTDRYKTPWGPAVNFDGEHNDGVRAFFIQSALYWIREFHMDALRLDAVHAITDFSPRPFLAELAEAVHLESQRIGRKAYLIPESDQNDPGLVLPPEKGGMGLDAVWNDDFHHSLRTLLTQERQGYYRDFGKLGQLAKAYREGFVHGNSSASIEADRFVVFCQNHDQVGNRALGERLSRLASFEKLKLAAGCVLLSPYLPLLFMGEEYGEKAPFLYFTSHSDPSLIQAVRKGRLKEFSAFGWKDRPPDPQDEETFIKSRLQPHLREEEPHKTLRLYYQTLIRLRKKIPALKSLDKKNLEVLEFEKEGLLSVRRWKGSSQTLMLASFGNKIAEVSLPLPRGKWRKVLGEGGLCPEVLSSRGKTALRVPPFSLILYVRRSSK